MPVKATERDRIAQLVVGINNVVSNGDRSQLEFISGPDLASNRGNKLKRKAAWAHEGSLGGQGPYKKRINHAGFDRQILHRNPLRLDLEGIPLDSDDEDVQADADAAERDPYHDVDVQGVLGPLTAVSDLWKHPGMSHALTNEALCGMVIRSREMLRKERKTLSLIKSLATKFRGDHIRTPSAMLLTELDVNLYGSEDILRGLPEIDALNVTECKTPEAAIAVNVVAADEPATNGIHPEDTQAEEDAAVGGGERHPSYTNGISDKDPDDQRITEIDPKTGIAKENGPEDTDKSIIDAPQDEERKEPPDSERQDENGDATEDMPAPRMVTRGAAAAANGTSSQGDEPEKASSPTPSASLPGIHPTFIPPHSSAPDRDLGLPPWEAEETRKLFNVFVQKQEEVVRGVEKLHDMFLMAEKNRKSVYWWSRAEAHAGEMSDGEEWVDLEEWGLDAQLRKGAAEGEEEGREEERKGKGRRTRNLG